MYQINLYDMHVEKNQKLTIQFSNVDSITANGGCCLFDKNDNVICSGYFPNQSTAILDTENLKDGTYEVYLSASIWDEDAWSNKPVNPCSNIFMLVVGNGISDEPTAPEPPESEGDGEGYQINLSDMHIEKNQKLTITFTHVDSIIANGGCCLFNEDNNAICSGYFPNQSTAILDAEDLGNGVYEVYLSASIWDEESWSNKPINPRSNVFSLVVGNGIPDEPIIPEPPESGGDDGSNDTPPNLDEEITNKSDTPISQQYSTSHEAIPNNPNPAQGAYDWTYRPRINPDGAFPQSSWNAIGHWMTSYLEKGASYYDNVGVLLQNPKMWIWNTSTKSWDVLSDEFEWGSWYLEDFWDDGSGIIPNTTLWGTGESANHSKWVKIKQTSETSGRCFHPWGYQKNWRNNPNWANNGQPHIITKIDFKLVKWDENGIDNLDNARIVVDSGADWWRNVGDVWQSDWSTSRDMAVGKYLIATRGLKRAYCTNLPENWSYGFPELEVEPEPPTTEPEPPTTEPEPPTTEPTPPIPPTTPEPTPPKLPNSETLKNAQLKIFNKDLEFIGIIEGFTSLRWVRRYYKSGEFELHCPLTIDTINFLKKDNIIYIGDRKAAYIVERKLDLDSNGNETLVIKGFSLTQYLNRRINWGRLITTDSAENVMRRLVYDNAINPSDSSRKIPFLELGELKRLSQRIDYQNSFGNVVECLESIAKSVEYGFNIYFDINQKKMIFETYEGVNRSINQSDNPPCVFSREFENIYSQTYTDSNDNYRNTALIAGAGEDNARKLTEISQGNGLNRYELFVDARDLSDTSEDDRELPWNEYESLLIQRGNEKLAECTEVTTFESKINVRGNLIYKKDFDLGDIVTCHDKKWGITIDTRITEIEEVYEGNKMEVNVTFGNNIPTLIDKIKSKMR